MGLAKFDAKLRQWRTLELRVGGNDSQLKNRTEHNSVESFLGLKNEGFAPFRSEGTFCGVQIAEWEATKRCAWPMAGANLFTQQRWGS